MYRALYPGTRQGDIVVLVARRGPMTLSEMADTVGPAATPMRQRVSRLVAVNTGPRPILRVS